MTKKPKLDRVVFRKFRDTGEIIALLPDNPANPGMVDSYMHVGQHGEASVGIARFTVRPLRGEHLELCGELRAIGYAVEMRERLTRVNNKRWAS